MAFPFTSCLLLLCIVAHASCIPQFLRSSASGESSEEQGNIWVVLVAGSNGWSNYRHQSDVCHAWQILVDNGVNPDNIITMMYDDIANNSYNPYPGKIFNHPNGTDVYEGVRIDYKGEDVSPTNFMAVLLGNETATNGKPVLKSTKSDKVFVYYTDHGGSGVVAFPSRRNSILTVKSLTETLEGMREREMYNELTFYMEACHSGSMFEGQLPNNSNIYAVSASNAEESSWACYCNTKMLPGNCLGDLFSVNWMEDTEKGNLNGRTLAEQFEVVKNRTKFPTTGDRVPGSNVLAFGELSIQEEYLSEFMGNGKAPANNSKNMEMLLEYSPSDFAMYPTQDIPLLMLAQQQKNGIKMHVLLKNRRYLEEQMNELVRKVLQKEDPIVQRRALKANPHPQGITQLECHHQIMHAFNDKCFNFAKNPYALKYSFMLTNLCELGIAEERIKATMMEHCTKLDTELEIV